MKPLFFLFLSATILSCNNSRTIPDNFDYGKITGGVYKNAYFNLEVPVPDTWAVQSKEQVEALQRKGNKMIAEKNEELGSAIKASEVSAANLLVVFKNNPDSLKEEFNPSLMVVAENLGSIATIKTSADYLDNVKKLMRQANMGHRFPSEIVSKKFGGKEFDVLKIMRNVTESIEVTQVYHTMIIKRFALSFITSFATAEQEEELMDVLHKIKFE